MKGVEEGTLWKSCGSEGSTLTVERVLKPLSCDVATDFEFVPDPRIFFVDVAGATQSVPVHLLLDELGSGQSQCALVDEASQKHR